MYREYQVLSDGALYLGLFRFSEVTSVKFEALFDCSGFTFGEFEPEDSEKFHCLLSSPH